MLNIKDKARFDLVSLGEVMLRLDPGEGRIRTTRQFNVWEGGGEYNVARALRKAFGMKTAIVTALAENEVGRLIEDLMWQGGVNTDYVRFVPYDGIGRNVRNGLNFTERGFGIRAALGVSDRANSAASQMKPKDINWDQLFVEEGTRWLHTGGIFTSLSEDTMDTALEAIRSARAAGTVVSYDFNYRPSLWKNLGGLERAKEVNREIVSMIDVLFGNVEDFSERLGVEIPGIDVNSKALTADEYRVVLQAVASAYPNLKVIASTLRTVHSASRNDWQGIMYLDGEIYESKRYAELEILDRVGGGDGFASGIIYALMNGETARAVDYGAAHGALVMTTPGDTSMANLQEIENIMNGGSVRIIR